MASRRMRLGDAIAAQAVADWLTEVGMFPPFRAIMASGDLAFHLPHPLMRVIHPPRDPIDLAILKLSSGPRTTVSSAT